MAGIIAFDSGDWYASGGAFRVLADGLTRNLGNDDVGDALREQLRIAVDSNLYFLNLERASIGSLTALLGALEAHLVELSCLRPKDGEEIGVNLAGYSDRLADLQGKLQQEIGRRPVTPTEGL